MAKRFIVKLTSITTFNFETDDSQYVEWCEDMGCDPDNPSDSILNEYITDCIENGDYEFDDPEIEIKPDPVKE